PSTVWKRLQHVVKFFELMVDEEEIARNPFGGLTMSPVADTPEEATALALTAQARCYPIPAECVECEHIDSYASMHPRVVAQGKRFPENTASEPSEPTA
ncbi:MAG: hypothetical protein FWE67_07050, partial [Planctomycetaceae bacterium]|nr:hypothetical protein [Planctomycetaceae bacterium]